MSSREQASGGMELDMEDTLRNPQGNFNLAVHDEEFPTEAFSQKEAQLLETQMTDLITSFSHSVHAELFKQREQVLAKAATYAKAELDGKVFGGINAGDNQIGFSVIRPGHVRADPATGNSENDWYFQPGTTGYTDWIGDGDANNYSVVEDQVTVVVGFTDQEVNTELSALNVQEFGRNMDMLPHDLNDAKVRDNDTEQQTVSLPTLIASDNDDVHIRLRADRDVESQPRLLGVTYALGDFLNNEDY